jgi:WD40 repeat protein
MLWNLKTAEVEHHFSQPLLFGPKVLVAPNGGQMLAISPAAGATLWDLETGGRIRQFGVLHLQGALSGSAWTADARFTENGKQIITKSHNGRGFHSIDVESGKLLWSFFMDGDGTAANLPAEAVPADAGDS